MSAVLTQHRHYDSIRAVPNGMLVNDHLDWLVRPGLRVYLEGKHCEDDKKYFHQ